MKTIKRGTKTTAYFDRGKVSVRFLQDVPVTPKSKRRILKNVIAMIAGVNKTLKLGQFASPFTGMNFFVINEEIKLYIYLEPNRKTKKERHKLRDILERVNKNLDKIGFAPVVNKPPKPLITEGVYWVNQKALSREKELLDENKKLKRDIVSNRLLIKYIIKDNAKLRQALFEDQPLREEKKIFYSAEII